MDASVCHRSCNVSHSFLFTGIASHSVNEECRIPNSWCDFSFATLTGVSEVPAILWRRSWKDLVNGMRWCTWHRTLFRWWWRNVSWDKINTVVLFFIRSLQLWTFNTRHWGYSWTLTDSTKEDDLAFEDTKEEGFLACCRLHAAQYVQEWES